MTPSPQRDSTGRFVRSEDTELAHSRHVPEDMHPLSKRLFGWVEEPKTPRRLLMGISALCILLVLSDMIVTRHDYFHFAEGIGFYALWGFGAFAFAVVSGWPLGALLRRDEDYYGEADTTPDDVEPDA